MAPREVTSVDLTRAIGSCRMDSNDVLGVQKLHKPSRIYSGALVEVAVLDYSNIMYD